MEEIVHTIIDPPEWSTHLTVKITLDHNICIGILEKVSHSDWASPIVTVPKKDGKYRICGDYKVTINQALDIDQYPLPNPKEIFASLAGGQKFTKLDLSQAYQQLLLEESSRNYQYASRNVPLY